MGSQSLFSPCKTCGKNIRKSDHTCPGCGSKQPSKIGARGVVIVVFFSLFLLILVSRLNSKHNGLDGLGRNKKEQNVQKQTISLSAYQRIQTGMSCLECEIIIGSRGIESSRNRIEGVPEVMESIDTVVYQWINDDGSNMNAIFQNDKLVQKAQFGLK